MNKIIYPIAMSALALAGTDILYADASYLPTTTRDGKSLYYYTAERGESVYGIAQKYEWNADTLMHYNPDATDIKHGQVLYYPVHTAATMVATPKKSISVEPSDIENRSATHPDVSHLVSTFYTIKANESLAQIARANSTSVLKIFELNPGLTPAMIEEGVKIKVLPGSDMEHSEYKQVKELTLAHMKQYKVKQKDSWATIATKYNIDTLQLKGSNSAISALSKGTKINIPVYKDTLVNKWVPIIDPRENTAQGIQELYKQAHATAITGATKEAPATLTITSLVACDDVSGRRRDMEFLKGFMMGLDGKKYGNVNVRFKGEDLASYGSLDKALAANAFADTNILIYCVDKNFPSNLIDYCEKHDIILLNVFDAKTDISEVYPGGIQLLPPSSYFYDRTSDFLTRVMNDRTFLFVDYSDTDSESVSTAILNRLRERGGTDIVMLNSVADLNNYSFNPAKSYTIVSEASGKEDINDVMASLTKVVNNYPNMPLSLIGRPNWMVYSQALEPQFRKLDTYIPSRFIFDSDSKTSKDFTSRYRSYFNATPLRSLPMYSVMGYDIANYFVDEYIKTEGDLNMSVPAVDMIQLNFKLERPTPYDGVMNRRVYLLHFTPFATTDVISL